VGALTRVTESAGIEIPIGELTFGDSLRGEGVNQAHVTLLVEAAGQWPPVLVWGRNNLLLDGCHRVDAARRLGHTRVLATRYSGSAEDAYLESLRRNISHGLPLSLEDRRRAARRILTEHPDWSDRRIACLCALSDKAIGRVRRDEREAVILGMGHRIGRDGRRRPVRPIDLTARIEQAIEQNPEGSLRAIAMAAGGASPETVRRVRARHQTQAGRVVEFAGEEPARENRDWRNDTALAASEDTERFAQWFTSTDLGDEWHQYVWSIPISRLYEIADEARRRANRWMQFVSLLEGRVQP